MISKKNIVALYFLLTTSAFPIFIDTGSCDENRIYSLHLDNTYQKIYFWKTFLFDGHNKKRSDAIYGYSFGEKMDCLREQKEIQDWDVQLIAARYAQDTEARFTKFMNISDEEFCTNSPQLLYQYCEPNRKSEIKNNSSSTEITKKSSDLDIDIASKLRELKKLLDDGLISQKQYDDKSTKILEQF
jgi:hypothetical protein